MGHARRRCAAPPVSARCWGKAVDKPSCAARIGGDEFAHAPAGGRCPWRRGASWRRSGRLTDLNNQFYPGMTLSLSMGAATSAFGERMEEVVRRADLAMYEAKRDFTDLRHDDRGIEAHRPTRAGAS